MPFPLLSLALAAQTAAGLPPMSTVERTLYVMGTEFRARVEATQALAASEALEAAAAEVERMEDLLSTWDPSTPMSRLNATPVDTPVEFGDELRDLLSEVMQWSTRTGGAFDPTVGALVDAWDLRGEGRVPAQQALSAALEAAGPAAMGVDATAGTLTRRHSAAWIDTGAFGKGAALRQAAHILRAPGIRRALLDLGGQVLALADETAEPWLVSVAHPTHRLEAAATLRLAGVSAATSGTSERWIEVDGRRYGHILDPRTGMPVPSWGSVTVVSADPLVADILSTALYVMGPDAGMAWAESMPDVGVLFLVHAGGDLQTLHNQAMLTWLPVPPAHGPQPLSAKAETRFP